MIDRRVSIQTLNNVTADTIRAVTRKMGQEATDDQIKFQTWSESDLDVLQDKNTLQYSLYRNPPREVIFKWVGPIEPDGMCFLPNWQSDKNFRYWGQEKVQDLPYYRGSQNHVPKG